MKSAEKRVWRKFVKIVIKFQTRETQFNLLLKTIDAIILNFYCNNIAHTKRYTGIYKNTVGKYSPTFGVTYAFLPLKRIAAN